MAHGSRQPARGVGPKWPGTGFGLANGGYYSEHAQIYDVLRKKGVTGLAVVAGDKHSFWAGLTSADLPPRAYDPVGVEFVTGSISAQGLVEIGDRIVKPDHALRALYYTGEHREIPAINYTLLHGVRAALALSRTSAAEAREASQPGGRAASQVRGSRRARVRPGHGDRRLARDRVRLHPGAVRTQRVG